MAASASRRERTGSAAPRRRRSRARGGNRLEAAAAARRPRAYAHAGAERVPHPDRLRGPRISHTRRAAPGDLWMAGNAAHCRRPRAAHAATALPGSSAGSGYPRPRELLAHRLLRGEERPQGPLPQTLLARRSAQRNTDTANAAARWRCLASAANSPIAPIPPSTSFAYPQEPKRPRTQEPVAEWTRK